MSMSAFARSDVGRVRTANQDSAYAGAYLFVVADGMGGHAGGDVASAIVVRDLAVLDRSFDSVTEAREALVTALQKSNDKLSRIVDDNPELAGLGTTVSAVLRVGERFVVAHIGDSRVYRLSADDLELVTKDHTFVQELIDSGRITPDEAKEHPRRSVLMRVLGDVDADPRIDTAEVLALDGERLLVCSDGLTGVIDDALIASVLRSSPDPATATARLVDLSLSSGAPDNVTVVVVEVGEAPSESRKSFVGSAASKRKLPTVSTGPSPTSPRNKTRTLPVITSEMPIPTTAPRNDGPKKATRVGREIDSAGSRRVRRRVSFVVGTVIVLGGLIAGGVWGYNMTQAQYYVGVQSNHVVVYQGVPVTFAGIALSHVYLDSGVALSSLNAVERQRVTDTISFDNASDAVSAMNRLIRGG